MNWTAWIFASTLAIASMQPAAHANETQEQSEQLIIDKVRKRYSTVQVLSARFVQVTHSTYGEETERGTVVLKRPRKMRWEFEGEGKQFVTNGQTMWIYNAAEKQVIRYTDLSSQSANVDSILQSLERLDEVYTITTEVAEGAGHALSMIPKETGDFKRIVMHLDENLVLTRLVLTDSFDSITDLRLSDVDLDAIAPDDTFTFTPPAGVELIDGSDAG
jgi:outer membrane lipoprotein carrier protein